MIRLGHRAPVRARRATLTGAVSRLRRLAPALPLVAVGVLALPFVALAVAAWVAGWQLRPLLTESMEPAYPAGSLLIVTPVRPADVLPGDAVMFEDPGRPGRLVAHRVVDRSDEGIPTFRTRGDANLADDPHPVPASAVRGVVRWSIPGLGRGVARLSEVGRLELLAAVPAGALVISELAARRRRRTRVRCDLCGRESATG